MLTAKTRVVAIGCLCSLCYCLLQLGTVAAVLGEDSVDAASAALSNQSLLNNQRFFQR